MSVTKNLLQGRFGRKGGAQSIALIGLVVICVSAVLFPFLRHETASFQLKSAGETQHHLDVVTTPAPTTSMANPPPAKGKRLQPDPSADRISRLLASALPGMHITHTPLTDVVATNALALFLSSLDFDHCFFLAGDIAKFQAQAPELENRLRNGDVSFAYDVFDIFRDRVSNRVAYVNQRLDKDIPHHTTDTYRWKRRNEPWPENEMEWNRLWDKKVRNEYIARIVNRKLLEEKAATSGMTNNPIQLETNGLTRITDQQNALLSPKEFIRKRYERFVMILNDSDAEWVLQLYLTAFCHAYDPHSDYMSASSTEDFDIGMKLSLVGIGAILSSEDGAAKIERLIPGGPADRDGRLKAGDKIIAVAQGDDEPTDVLHWPLSRTVRLIRGEKGTPVTLSIIPASDITGSVVVPIRLIRDEVKLEEQAAKSRVETNTTAGISRTLGVITLPAFYVDMKSRLNDRSEFRSSTRDVAQLVRELRINNNIKGLILDLRNNGGGSLAEAVEMTGLFIPSGPIVQVKESRGNIQPLSDPDPTVLYGGPLVVLVNRQSASASEILAGSLQDYGRAILIGDSKTHGKGTVQSLVNLDQRDPRMGSLKVTTASFHRINGDSTQRQGIIPDIVLPALLDVMEVGEEFLPQALPWSRVPASLYKPVRDLRPAVEILRRQSEARTKTDPRFIAQRKLIKRYSDQQAALDIPLDLEARITMAREESDLQKIEESIDNEDSPPSPKDEDLTLTEALSILNDLITLDNPENAK